MLNLSEFQHQDFAVHQPAVTSPLRKILSRLTLADFSAALASPSSPLPSPTKDRSPVREVKMEAFSASKVVSKSQQSLMENVIVSLRALRESFTAEPSSFDQAICREIKKELMLTSQAIDNYDEPTALQ